MDKETAKKVLEIMLNADGGCEYCVRELYLKFIKEFPEYSYLARKIYRENSCDVIIKSVEDLEFYENFYGTVTYEALREGQALWMKRWNKMKTLEELKKILAEHKDEIREKYGVVILGVFGSYAREEQKETSDVDIIVELERPIGLKFYEFWDYIENILGTKADVLTLSALKQKTLLWEKVKEDIVYV